MDVSSTNSSPRRRYPRSIARALRFTCGPRCMDSHRWRIAVTSMLNVRPLTRYQNGGPAVSLGDGSVAWAGGGGDGNGDDADGNGDDADGGDAAGGGSCALAGSPHVSQSTTQSKVMVSFIPAADTARQSMPDPPAGRAVATTAPAPQASRSPQASDLEERPHGVCTSVPGTARRGASTARKNRSSRRMGAIVAMRHKRRKKIGSLGRCSRGKPGLLGEVRLCCAWPWSCASAVSSDPCARSAWARGATSAFRQPQEADRRWRAALWIGVRLGDCQFCLFCGSRAEAGPFCPRYAQR